MVQSAFSGQEQEWKFEAKTLQESSIPIEHLLPIIDSQPTMLDYRTVFTLQSIDLISKLQWHEWPRPAIGPWPSKILTNFQLYNLYLPIIPFIGPSGNLKQIWICTVIHLNPTWAFDSHSHCFLTIQTGAVFYSTMPSSSRGHWASAPHWMDGFENEMSQKAVGHFLDGICCCFLVFFFVWVQ